jgi:fucose permease
VTRNNGINIQFDSTLNPPAFCPSGLVMSSFNATAVASGHIADRGPQVFAGTLSTLIIATVFVAARLVSRCCIVRNFSWDDKVITLAWLVAFFLSFTILLGTQNGLGLRDEHINPTERGVLRKCEYVFSILYNPALALMKTSVLIFYLRLAKNTQVVLRYSSYFLLVVVNITALVLTFMNIFQCTPISAAWNPYYAGKVHCIPLLTEFICASPVNVITDLALLALPLATLSKMRLPTRQKIILILTFSLGIFVTVIDVVRIHELQAAISDVRLGKDHGATFGGQADFAWNASLSFMWSAVEVNIGMACACVPTLKPLILRLLPAMLYDPDGTRSSGKSSGSKVRSDQAAASNPRQSAEVTVPAIAALPYPTSGEEEEEDPYRSRRTNQAHTTVHGEEPMSAMEFLTAPDTIASSLYTRPRARTYLTAATAATAATANQDNAVYFGFVNMTKPKSLLETSTSESFRYCSTVAILFLLWGLSYGLLNTLNNVVASINNLSTAQTLGLTSAYFGGGYFFGPLLVGEWILRRDEHNRSRRHQKDVDESVGGFKVTFICGLCFYGTGTMIFWPSAVTNSYGGFMVSNFIVGFGLSVLEVAANAFIILCGPPQYGETRLLICQAVQGIGSVLSGVLANKVFFKDIGPGSSPESSTLLNVQWTYLAITLLCAALGLFFFYMPLPEVSDQELEDSAKHLPVDTQKPFAGLQLRTWSLVLAVATQYMYVASQESNSIYFRDLLVSILPHAADSGEAATAGTTSTSDPMKPPGLAISIPDYLLIGHTAFTISRLLTGYLTYLSVHHPRFPRPRTLLTIFLTLSFLFALLPVVLRPSNANLLVIPVVLFFFAEGPVWPLVFAIGLRGQGRRTKRAAAFITMGGSGGGAVPFIMYGIIAGGGTVRISFIVIVVLQVLMMSYPLFLESVRDARLMVEPLPGASSVTTGSEDEETPVDELVAAAHALRVQSREEQRNASPDEKSPSNQGFLRKFSQGFERLTALRRRSDSPEVEHSETTTSQ